MFSVVLSSLPPRAVVHLSVLVKVLVAMSQQKINIRPAAQGDLESINRVIEAAVMGWQLPERVKRLSLPSYRYTGMDLNHLETVVAEDNKQNIIGIAAWERADAKDTPAGRTALLLHGIYVAPSHHRQGVGRRLLRVAEQAVRKYRYSGLVVKAQADASEFFLAQGMSKLQVKDPQCNYANRFWRSVDRL